MASELKKRLCSFAALSLGLCAWLSFLVSWVIVHSAEKAVESSELGDGFDRPHDPGQPNAWGHADDLALDRAHKGGDHGPFERADEEQGEGGSD